MITRMILAVCMLISCQDEVSYTKVVVMGIEVSGPQCKYSVQAVSPYAATVSQVVDLCGKYKVGDEIVIPL